MKLDTARMLSTAEPGRGLLDGFDPGGNFCELSLERIAASRDLSLIWQRLNSVDPRELRRQSKQVEADLYNLGITFTVYSNRDAIDRVLPFDVIPRVFCRQEWARVEAGVVQRVAAINLFLWDVYHERKILKDGVIPPDLVLGNPNYREQMIGFPVRHGTYAHVTGIDIVRDEAGRFLVLEDNARTPSGVSYVVENRRMMLRSFPDWMVDLDVRPVDDYGFRLEQAMAEVSVKEVADPQVVLLSPGIYNSAYFEHVFLAREMGVPLVEGRDLLVDEDDRVFMRTIAGLEPVHAIYRRIDDDFLDPEVFRRDSVLGVPGLMRAWRKGNVSIANAVGTGVADDKAVYAYMPRMIRYYLDEDPILDNVETHICRETEALKYTLDNLDKLVVKPVGESGGYGILIGPKSTRTQIKDFREQLKRKPDNYISQPMVKLSVAPTLTKSGIGPRHVDLRPYAVTGRETWVLPGGLTRVALPKGSLMVNSSQGGGSKDTWVLG